MGKKTSKGEWLRRQNKDQYVLTSRREGLRSRAAFKLEQINKKYKIMNSGYRVLDLGCAPGGWLTVARKYVGPNGKIVGVDLLDMDPIDGIDFIKGDFRDPKIVEQIQERTENQGLDLVISDMAPNITGVRIVDDSASRELAEEALNTAFSYLAPGGRMVAKLFQGPEAQSFMAEAKECFLKTVLFKPAASRSESREIFVVADGFKAGR